MSREEFEKLPEIAAHIHNVIFDIGCGEYLPKNMGYVIHEFSAYFLNGAWYAFQEQQKKIDAVLKHIEREEWSDEYGDNQCPTQVIKGLLK